MVTKSDDNDSRVGSPKGMVAAGFCRWNQGVLEQYIPNAEGGNTWTPVPHAGDRPAATLTAITPAEAQVGSPDPVEVTLTGTGFVEGATIIFDGVAKSAEYVSPQELRATVDPSLVTEPKIVSVTVKISAQETEPPLTFSFMEPIAPPLARSQSAPSKAEAQNHKAKSGREKETV